MKTPKIFTEQKRKHNRAVKNSKLPIFTGYNKNFSDYISYSLCKKDNKLIDAIKYAQTIGFEKLRKVIPEYSKSTSDFLHLRSGVYLKNMYPKITRLDLCELQRLICDLYYHWIDQKIKLQEFNK